MLDRIHDPQLLYTEISHRLAGACESRERSFNRFTLATTGDVRTIILRDFDAKDSVLTFFTDIRSNKVDQIRGNPKMTWLFYDPAEKVQLRIRTDAFIHHENEVSHRYWKQVPEVSRSNYATRNPPGTVIGETLYEQQLDPLSAESHFAVICGRIDAIEILQLLPDRHLRAILSKNGWLWNLNWIVP